MPIIVKSDIPNTIQAARKFMRVIVPLMANKAKNHYIRGFATGGRQTDASSGGWAPRKRKDKQKTKRAILVKTGTLRKDIDVRRTTSREIVLGTSDTDYGIYHNEGAKYLPKREFLGPSKKLDTKLRRLALRKFKEIFE